MIRSFFFILHNTENYDVNKLQKISKHVDYKRVVVLKGESIFKVF